MSSIPSISPRVIVITGASSGLGAGLARAFAAPGRVLGLVARNCERLNEVAEACVIAGANVQTAVMDVGDPDRMPAWLQGFDAAYPVDLVIANAGVTAGTRPDGELEGMEAARTVVRTNLLGVIHTVEPLLPVMQRRRAGHIAVMASIASYRGLPDSPAYCASKAGVRSYGESLRALLEPCGVDVSVIVPGFFLSPMTDRHLGRKLFLLSAEQATAHVYRGLCRRERRIVFPRRLAWMMRALDLLPAGLSDRLIRSERFRVHPHEDQPTV